MEVGSVKYYTYSKIQRADNYEIKLILFGLKTNKKPIILKICLIFLQVCKSIESIESELQVMHNLTAPCFNYGIFSATTLENFW